MRSWETKAKDPGGHGDATKIGGSIVGLDGIGGRELDGVSCILVRSSNDSTALAIWR